MVPADHVLVVDVHQLLVDVEDAAGRSWKVAVQPVSHRPVEELVQPGAKQNRVLVRATKSLSNSSDHFLFDDWDRSLGLRNEALGKLGGPQRILTFF